MTATSQASAEDLRLEVVAGKASGFAILVADQLIIGRHSEGPGRLADDPELSRQHAQTSREDDGRYVIEDLASTNGTLVNGSRISSPTPLAVGDSIEVGATTIRVAQAPAPPDAAAAPSPVDVRAATVTVDVPGPMRSGPSAPADGAPPAESAPPTEPQQPLEAAAEPAPPAPVEESPPTFEEPPAPVEEPQAAVEEPVAEPDTLRLALQVVFDPQRAEVEIQLGEEFEPIRLALIEGRWQVPD